MSDVHRKDVELYRGLEPVLGADVATMLLERLPPPHEELATRHDLDRFATKTDLQAFATKTDLQAFATKTDLQAFATKADLQAFATKTDLQAFATKTDLQAFATKADLEALHVDDRFEQASRELDLKLAAQSAELKGFVHEVVGGAIQTQTRIILVGMAGIMAGATTLAAALGQLV